MPVFATYQEASAYAAQKMKEGYRCSIGFALNGYSVDCVFTFGRPEGEEKKQQHRQVRSGEQTFIAGINPNINYEYREYQQKALDAILAKKHITVAMPTAAGKTAVGIFLIEKLRLPTVIIVPKIDIMNHWIEELKRQGIEAVGFYAESHVVGYVTVMTYQSAVRSLDVLRTFKIAILDEVHHAYSSEYSKIFDAIRSEYIVGFTATPLGKHEAGFHLQEMILPVGFNMTVPEYQRTPYSIPIELRLIPVLMSPDEKNKYEEFTHTLMIAQRSIGPPSVWASPELPVEKQALARKALAALTARRELLTILPEKERAFREVMMKIDGQRVIIFTESVESAFRLEEILNGMGIRAGAIHSGMGLSAQERARVLADFREGKITALISVYALEEGVNVPEVSNAVFYGTSRAGLRYIVQRLGRIMRFAPNKVAYLYVIYAAGTIEEKNAMLIKEMLNQKTQTGKFF